jgi:hypothetical protein
MERRVSMIYKGVGRGAADGGAAEVPQNLDLARGVASGYGHDGSPDGLRAGMGAQAAGKQAVAVGDVHDIPVPRAAGDEGAGHAVGPDLQVVVGVPQNLLLARGAGGRLDAHDAVHGHGEQAEGIVVGELGLVCEGQLRDILDGFDVAGLDAGFLIFFMIMGNVFIHVGDNPGKLFSLQLGQFVPRHGLVRFIPVQHIYSSNL